MVGWSALAMVAIAGVATGVQAQDRGPQLAWQQGNALKSGLGPCLGAR
jgi:hypothetical protein